MVNWPGSFGSIPRGEDGVQTNSDAYFCHGIFEEQGRTLH
jgi:hypothetical protein